MRVAIELVPVKTTLVQITIELILSVNYDSHRVKLQFLLYQYIMIPVSSPCQFFSDSVYYMCFILSE